MLRFVVFVVCMLVNVAGFAYGTAGKRTMYTSTAGKFTGTGGTAKAAAESLCRQQKAESWAYWANQQDYEPREGPTPTWDGQTHMTYIDIYYGGVTKYYQSRIGFACGGGTAAENPFGNASCVGDVCVYNKGYRKPPAGTVDSGGGSQSTDGVPYTCDQGGLSFKSGYGPVPTVENAMAPRLTCLSGAGSTPGSAASKYAGCQLEFKADTAKCGAGMTCYGVGTDVINGEYCENQKPVLPGQGQAPPIALPPIPFMPPVAPCDAGTCPGTVNGSLICVACTTQSNPGAGQAASAPAGVPLPPLPNAPPGATSSQDQTTCTSGGCTTTTTWYGPTGVAIGSSSKTDGKPSNAFCTDNPTATICKVSSFGGSCGAITCDGDAIQCAMAREQSRRNCEVLDAAPGNHPGVLAANGQAQPAGHPGAAPDNVTIGFSSLIDQSNGGLSGGCISDESFAVGNGGTVTIPWSRLCGPLSALGVALQGIALLWAAFIAFKT